MKVKKLRDSVKGTKPKTPEDRMAIFDFLRHNDFQTPDFGLISELLKTHDSLMYCVAYPHDGRGRMMRLIEAGRRYPTSFASMFVGEQIAPSPLQRMVQLADRTYWVEYHSSVWCSRLGTGWKGKVMRYMSGWHPSINAPIFSIDSIKYNNVTYAIDFDLIPGLYKSGLEKILSPKEIKKLILKGEQHFKE